VNFPCPRREPRGKLTSKLSAPQEKSRQLAASRACVERGHCARSGAPRMRVIAASCLLFSWGALSLLVSFAARFTPRAREIHMDSTVLLFTLAVAVLTSVLSGTAPALAARDTVVDGLKEGACSRRSESAGGDCAAC